MSKKDDKTNVMRMLDQKKIHYIPHSYTELNLTNGSEIARALNEDPKRVFKTLVTVSKSKQNYVFVIPVEEELDLKAAAKVVGEKSIAMLLQKELLPLTGYVHGGCSPIGMKKVFPTVIHESAKNFETILFSGGKVGYQVEMNPGELEKVIRVQYGDIIVHS